MRDDTYKPIRRPVKQGQYLTDTIEIMGKDYPIRVYYEHHKAIRGAVEAGTGVPLEPNEPEWWEVISILLEINDDFIEMDASTEFIEETEDWLRDELS